MTKKHALAATGVRVVHPWPPVVTPTSRVLVLGSVPSPRSLQEDFYYGHPRNAFWFGIDELCRRRGVPAATPLAEASRAKKIEALQTLDIALWDVCGVCVAKGSADSKLTQVEANDFEAFFADHPHISHVIFNGKSGLVGDKTQASGASGSDMCRRNRRACRLFPSVWHPQRRQPWPRFP